MLPERSMLMGLKLKLQKLRRTGHDYTLNHIRITQLKKSFVNRCLALSIGWPKNGTFFVERLNFVKY